MQTILEADLISRNRTRSERRARPSIHLFIAMALFACTWLTGYATELSEVRGIIFVESGDGRFFVYEPHTQLERGTRVILTEGASARLRYDGCSQLLSENSINQVDRHECLLSRSHFMLASDTSVATSDTAAMTGFVWNDLDNNRIQDPGETAMTDVKVALVNSSCQIGVDCPIATSDTDGNFSFANLAPGTYEIGTVDDRDGFLAFATLGLNAGTTTSILMASTTAGFILVESTVATAAVASGATTGAATGSSTAAGSTAATSTATAGTTASTATAGAAASTATAGAAVTAGTVAASLAGTLAVTAVVEAATQSDDSRETISP